MTQPTFDLLSPDVMQCPFPAYERLRQESPVVYVASVDAYFVTRYDLVAEILRDTKTFSSNFGRAGLPPAADFLEALAAVKAEGYPRLPTLLTADQPAHTRFRRLVSKAFSPRTIALLEPTIREVTVRLIESWKHQPEIEFVRQFAVPLPVEVIAVALGVAPERRAEFKKWSDDAVATIGRDLSLADQVEAERGINDMQRYFAEELECRRTEPQDDLLTHLVQARIDDEDADVVDRRPLDMAEMLSILQQLMVAGNETTTKMLAEMMRLLASHPAEWQALREDPSRIESVIEETLRYLSPSHGMWRIATRDVEIAGVTIPAGKRLVISFGSANRDETVFGDTSEQFCPSRERLNEHLAFGRGIHFCIGAALARMEGRIALQELVNRIGDPSLIDEDTLAYLPSFMLRGLVDLPIKLAQRA
jgi:cytochrome P450